MYEHVKRACVWVCVHIGVYAHIYVWAFVSSALKGSLLWSRQYRSTSSSLPPPNTSYVCCCQWPQQQLLESDFVVCGSCYTYRKSLLSVCLTVLLTVSLSISVCAFVCLSFQLCMCVCHCVCLHMYTYVCGYMRGHVCTLCVCVHVCVCVCVRERERERERERAVQIWAKQLLRWRSGLIRQVYRLAQTMTILHSSHIIVVSCTVCRQLTKHSLCYQVGLHTLSSVSIRIYVMSHVCPSGWPAILLCKKTLTLDITRKLFNLFFS